MEQIRFDIEGGKEREEALTRRLVALAERLGVEPDETNAAPLLYVLPDGRGYAFDTIFHAVLDRIEAAT